MAPSKMPLNSVPRILRKSFIVPDQWSPTRIRQELLTAIAGIVKARSGLTYSWIQDGREMRLCELTAIGEPDFVKFVPTTDGIPYSQLVSTDPCSPDYDTSFVEDPCVAHTSFVIVRAEQFADAGLIVQLWRPHLIKACLGLIIIHAGRIMGWIGVYRHDHEPDFTAADKAALRPYIAIVTERLVQCSRRASALYPDSESYAVFSNSGTLQKSTPAMERWCTEETYREALSAAVSRFVAGGEKEDHVLIGRGRVKLLCLGESGASGPPRASPHSTGTQGGDLIIARVIQGVHPKAPVGLRLTPALRKVADIAVLGATVPEIARSLEKSPETVRVQLRDIYQRLGLASRIELVQLMGCIPVPTPGGAEGAAG